MSDEQQVETPEISAAPADEQVETPSGSAPDENAPNPDAPKEDKVQKRIDRLTREKYDAARDAEFWKAKAMAVAVPAETAKLAPVADDEPKEDDFANAADYVKAVAKHAVEQDRKVRQADEARQQQERNQTELARKVQSDIAEAKKSLPDFDDVMEDAEIPNNANTAAVIRELQESDNGANLLYHIVKDKAQMDKLFAMSDRTKIARELGRIEARITSAPARSQATIPSTPQPIKPVSASRQAVANLPATDDDAEYFRQREAQAAGKR